jgi:hypothetical protein
MRRTMILTVLIALVAACDRAPVTAPAVLTSPNVMAPQLAVRLPSEPQANLPPPALAHVSGRVIGRELVILGIQAPDSPMPVTHPDLRYSFRFDVDQNPRTPGHHETPRDTFVCDFGAEYLVDMIGVYPPPGPFIVSALSPYDCNSGPEVGLGRCEITGRVIRWKIPLAVLGGDDGAVTVGLALFGRGGGRATTYRFDTHGRCRIR